jgi:hypothetical protein
MQQRQLRLGDILDDYCPRERRLTNHVVVAMIGADVKQTRCSTCEAEHEYKQAKLPRLRRKADAPVLATPVAPLANVVLPPQAPAASPNPSGENDASSSTVQAAAEPQAGGSPDKPGADGPDQDADAGRDDEGPVHRPLIRASLPRLEGAPPPSRPATDFTIRQPAGRQNRFRPRHAGGGQQPQGNRSGGHMGGGGGPLRGGMPRHGGHQPVNRLANRHGQGRKRSK